ncbi:MAG: class I SAM-dependent methyltransferase [Caulobacteraceae bacterium]
MELWRDFLTNRGKAIHKWEHYFPIYERHFEPWRGRSLTFLEIGVAKGGSLDMWRRGFGPLARIVGIDIDPTSRRHEGPGIFVRVGDQSDPGFLRSIVEEFGAPDIVLDDGSHQMADVRASFEFLYPRLPKNGVYLIEDLHTAYWKEYGGGVDEPASFVNFAKSMIDKLNADHARGAVEPDAFTRDTFCLAFYDSVIVFEKGHAWRKASSEIGGGRGRGRS